MSQKSIDNVFQFRSEFNESQPYDQEYKYSPKILKPQLFTQAELFSCEIFCLASEKTKLLGSSLKEQHLFPFIYLA